MNFLFDSKAVKGLSTAIVAAGALVMPAEAFATDWTGVDPSTASGNVYLYNVGTKKFLGKGGIWGTQGVVSYEGTMFVLTSSSNTFNLRSHVKGETDSTNGYLQFMDGTAQTSIHDTGIWFVDGSTTNNRTFTAVKQDDGSYLLYVTGQTTSTTDYSGKNCYLTVEEDNTLGVTVGTPTTVTDNQKWIVVTESERRSAFEKADAAESDPVAATFLMYDFDFARKDNACSYWKTGDGNTLTYKSNTVVTPSMAEHKETKTTTYTYTSTHDYHYSSRQSRVKQHQDVITTTDNHGDSWETTCQTGGHDSDYTTTCTYIKTSSKETTTVVQQGYTYYLGNGYDEKDYTTDPITGETNTSNYKNLQGVNGGYWTANIHGAAGSITQTLEKAEMVRKGYYKISCKAFTTATTGKVRLWAAANSTEGNGSADDQTKTAYAYEAISTIETAPKTYVDAYKTLSATTTDYDASVVVYVSDITNQQLTFGIYVNDAESTAWTCINDFAIQYLGDPQYTLVLDEDQESGDYIKSQAIPNDKELTKSTLYLHRTMNAGTWNTLVLPVNLTVGQVKSAFGSSVQISEFKGAVDEKRPNTIIFESISADRDKENETAIKADNLYLVKVDADKAMPTNMTEIEVPTTETKLTSYYTIAGVTFKQVKDVENVDYSKKVTGDSGSEQYNDNENMVKFVGTYVKGSSIIPENSYVIAGKNTENAKAGKWYYRTAKTTSKGFRGWLETYQNQGNAKLTYIIDGVEETAEGATNSIAEAFAGEEKAVSGNIYSISGQLVRQNATSVEGLPAGIYVNNGMKIVVK